MFCMVIYRALKMQRYCTPIGKQTFDQTIRITRTIIPNLLKHHHEEMESYNGLAHNSRHTHHACITPPACIIFSARTHRSTKFDGPT